MTDDEVTQLYRCLLGRDPENAGTIAAFKSYYPTIERGRRAVLTSDEFAGFFTRVTGRSAATRDPVAASLSLMLLSRAASVPADAEPVPRDAALRSGMAQIFPTGHAPRLGVVVGDAGPSIEDLLPFQDPQSAILHIAPGFPAAMPLAGALADGTTVFKLDGDPAAIAELLRQFGRGIDALCLLGPASADWSHALRPYFSRRTLVLVGPARPGVDADAVSAAIVSSHEAGPVQAWRGLRLHHHGGWLLPVSYQPPSVIPPAPALEAYPSLAIAAIVRNEAVCVENMLASARPVASFYAVLDTGSVDGTQALSQAFLSASGVPHAFAERSHATFDDDFAAMRNAALAMVPDWVDWVLMLDADEALAPEDYGPLLALIATGTHDVYALPRYNFPGADTAGRMIDYPDRQMRLLRHTPDGRIGYSGVVHETVRDVHAGYPALDASAVGGARGGPHIHHLVRRFRTPEQEERKQAFYREIASRTEAVLS